MTPATTLAWSPELALGDVRTDTTHEEFVELVNAVSAAAPEARLALYQELVKHTVEHFAQEERWMAACGIPADFCHFSQHNSVLEVMREVERRALLGELPLIESMLEALVEWFPQHAQSMDAGLVTYLAEKGFDTTSETFKAGAGSAAAELPSCSSHQPGQSCG
jgi:hemerythrin